jgi:hypothetical protein
MHSDTPEIENVLKFFKYEHLNEPLRSVSKEFHDMAHRVARGPQNAESAMALRKLLEAKDCAVRAHLP